MISTCVPHAAPRRVARRSGGDGRPLWWPAPTAADASVRDRLLRALAGPRNTKLPERPRRRVSRH